LEVGAERRLKQENNNNSTQSWASDSVAVLGSSLRPCVVPATYVTWLF